MLSAKCLPLCLGLYVLKRGDTCVMVVEPIPPQEASNMENQFYCSLETRFQSCLSFVRELLIWGYSMLSNGLIASSFDVIKGTEEVQCGQKNQDNLKAGLYEYV